MKSCNLNKTNNGPRARETSASRGLGDEGGRASGRRGGARTAAHDAWQSHDRYCGDLMMIKIKTLWLYDDGINFNP